MPLTFKHYILALLLTLLLVILYNLNGRASSSVDTLPATLLPVSMLKYHDANLTEFEGFFHPQPDLWRAGFVFGALQNKDGEIISSYPLGGAVLAAPFYALARIAGILKPDDWQSYRLTGKLAASFLVAMSAGVIFLCLSQLLPWSSALWLSLAYGLGTGAFSTASQGMWQHGPGMLCLSVALWAVVNLERHTNPRYLIAFAAGVALTLAVWCRNVNVFAAGAVSLYVLIYQRRLLWIYAAPLVVGAVWLLQYNYSHFGNLSGGYDAILDSPWHRSRNLLVTGLFQHPLWQGLLDTWLSPSKGLLIYSPFMIFAFAPLWIKINSQRRLLFILFLWVSLTSVVLAKNSLWWGGTSFGPRYFLEMSVALVVLIGLVYSHLPRLARYGLNALIVLSVSIHTLGAFYAPCGWAETPEFADFKPQRHWDWRDTEIQRCLAEGYNNGPLKPDFNLGQLVQ